jgi:hypothetical protein
MAKVITLTVQIETADQPVHDLSRVLRSLWRGMERGYSTPNVYAVPATGDWTERPLTVTENGQRVEVGTATVTWEPAPETAHDAQQAAMRRIINCRAALADAQLALSAASAAVVAEHDARVLRRAV